MLEQLLLTDLKAYPDSSISDMQKRIADVPRKELQKTIYGLVSKGELVNKGSKTYRTYSLAEKKRKEKEKGKENT
ncbi:MAG: hypothetical protein RIS47_96 [Bacteroidota bacterium]